MDVGDPLIEDLARIVGVDHVLVGADVRREYEVDWTRRFSGTARAVVRPGSAAEVARLLPLCADAGVPITVQGGNTGLVGGAVPMRGGIVLSTRRLSMIGQVDRLSGQVTVGAGTTLESVQRHVRAVGLEWPMDLASRGSATIGGMIATNAGGARAVRYGSARRWLLGVEAALPSGDRIGALLELAKDNTGYDWASILAGSEGTLGVVTAARLQLVPLAAHRTVALLGVESTEAAVALAGDLRWRVPSVSALELFFDEGLGLVVRHRGLERPFAATPPAYLLVEASGATDPSDELIGALDGRPEILDAAIATDGPAQRRLWDLREAHSDAVAAMGVPHKLDVAVPMGRLAVFLHQATELIGDLAAMAELVVWGHAGDGNLHLNILGIGASDGDVDDAILRLAIAHGGSISGEHGVGRAKARWLPLMRSSADMTAMRGIKSALDPAWSMNPGVLFD
jgi:FAD/FMN-containing dehydrogenase